MKHHLTEEQLILHYYGETGGQAHLDGCEHCREQYRGLQRALNLMDAYTAPEPGDGYEAAVWQQIEGKLAARSRAQRWSWLWEPKQWAVAGALAALLAVAFFAGRYSRNPANEPAEQQAAVGFDSRILLSAVGNHLDRSQMVLVELTNEPSGFGPPIEDVRDLLEANRLYRTSADQAGEVQLADTLDELERLLVEVAHLAPKLTPQANEELRRRILDQGIIMKMRVVGSQVREREKFEY